MTEDKIKEAFEVHKRSMDIEDSPQFIDFKAGYMDCLNSLEYAATLHDNGKDKVAYFLPEGVAK